MKNDYAFVYVLKGQETGRIVHKIQLQQANTDIAPMVHFEKDLSDQKIYCVLFALQLTQFSQQLQYYPPVVDCALFAIDYTVLYTVRLRSFCIGK